MSEDKDLTIRILRQEIRQMQIALERKNKELDALNYVWCSGGCEGGVRRFTEGEITDEIVKMAELNTKRLRAWWNTRKRRITDAGTPTR